MKTQHPLLRPALLGGFGLVLVASLYTVTLALDGTSPQEQAWHAPSPYPDRLVLTWADDPATTQSVTWRTSVAVDDPIAEIAVAEDGPDFVKNARELEPTTNAFTSDLGEAYYHSITFRDLEPETTYAYRVGDGIHWSPWNQFTTRSREAKPLKFLYVGDAQNDIYSLWSRLIRQGYTTAPDVDFLLHAGDLVNRANRDAEWGEWFRAAGWINGKTPSLATPGNHEYSRETDGRHLSGHWRPTFTLPENGVEGLEETCYYLDVQGIRFVSLNTNEMQDEQAKWLDEVLADNPNRWTILTFHHPIYSVAKGRNNDDLRALWKPIIERHGVDLVLSGHDHTYARSNMMSGSNFRAPSGTVYVVSVSGPKMYEVERVEWMERAAERTQLFQIIDIDGDELKFRAYTALGREYDGFTLSKQVGGKNRMTNEVPDTPERLPTTD